MNDEPERPRLLIVAGPNGSGKTTITEQGLAHTWFQGCNYINPDLIARDDFGDWNSPDAVLKAAREAERRREASLVRRESIAVETVFSAPDKIDYVRRAIAAGYFVRLFFVGTASPTINAARVARRVMEGGHDVPISKIVSRYIGSGANCAEIANAVDRLYLYDNSVDDAEPALVLRAARGAVLRQYQEPPSWLMPIVARLTTPARSSIALRRAQLAFEALCARGSETEFFVELSVVGPTGAPEPPLLRRRTPA